LSSGFLGLASLVGRGIDPSLTARLRSSAPRGGHWSSEQACLVSVDAPLSRQSPGRPSVDPSGGVAVFSGHLFDPAAVARSLGIDPARADAAIAAAWIARYGLDRLADLPGDFALAHWSPHDARLVLAVAPMAGRAIYWHHSDGVVSFATSPAALHRIPSVPREIDPLQFTAHLTARTGDPCRTIYRDVSLLPPGRMVVADQHGCRQAILWEPDLDRRVRLGSDAAYVEAARELLDRSVANRLRTARSPALLASGGLDSAAMLVSAARQAGDQPVNSYTAIPPPGIPLTSQRNRYSSEEPGVEALAQQYPNLRARFCHAETPAAIETDPARQFMITGLPSMTANHLGWFDPAHRAIQNAGHDVVLTGDMGNFTLSYGGQACFSDLVREGRLLTAARLLPRFAAYSGRRSRDIVRGSILMPLVPRGIGERHRRRRQGRHPMAEHAAIQSAWLDDVGISEYLQGHGEGSSMQTFPGSRQQIAYFVQYPRLVSLQNRLTLESLYGFQVRDPYADRDLLEFCLAIPREQFIVDGRDRSLARRVLEGRAPASIVDEVRFGHQKPEWVFRLDQQREAFAADLESFGRHPMLAEMLDVPRLRTLLDQMPKSAEAGEGRMLDYTVTFARSIQMGRFVRWVTGANQ
jgi:asparagine synthase (glutamine-hydrolysing)